MPSSLDTLISVQRQERNERIVQFVGTWSLVRNPRSFPAITVSMRTVSRSGSSSAWTAPLADSHFSLRPTSKRRRIGVGGAQESQGHRLRRMDSGDSSKPDRLCSTSLVGGIRKETTSPLKVRMDGLKGFNRNQLMCSKFLIIGFYEF